MKNKARYTGPLLILLLSINQVRAQSGDTLRLTMENSVQMGLQNRPDLQSLQKNILIAENSLKKGKNQALPELNINGDIRYNTKLATTVLPEGFAGSTTSTKTQFGTKNNTSVSAEYEQTLYSPTFQTDIKILRNNIDIEKAKLKQQEKEARYQIIDAYNEALLKQKEWQLSNDDKDLSAELLAVGENKFHLGTLLENEYLKLKLDYKNKEWEEKKAEQNFIASISRLKKEINYTKETPVKLTGDFSGTAGETLLLSDTSFSNNTEVKELQLQKQDYAYNFQKAQKATLPTISLTGNYTTQYQADNFNYFNTWTPYNYIGLKMTLPLFSKGNNKADKKEYTLRQQQSDLDIVNKKLSLNYDYTKGRADFANAQYNLKYATENYDLASKIYITDLQRYNLGKLLYSELVNSETSKLNARKNLIQTMYDWQVSAMNLEKLVKE